MASSLTWYPRLATFFPKHLPVARLIARLLALWGDLLYEQEGLLVDDGLRLLDSKLGSDARRMYFLRANSRTLYSAQRLLDALKADATFSAWLSLEETASEVFMLAKKTFDRHRMIIEKVRNTIGAHAEWDLGNAVDAFEMDDRAAFEIHSEDFMRPHLATSIWLAALLLDTPAAERMQKFRSFAAPLAESTGAMIRAMSVAIDLYMRHLKLLP